MKHFKTAQDREVYKPYFFKQLFEAASVATVFILIAIYSTFRETLNFSKTQSYLLKFFIPVLLTGLFLFYFKYIFDYWSRFKIVREGYLNVVNLFEKPAPSHIQVIFEDNRFLNFKLDYDKATQLEAGTKVKVSYTLLSKYLLSIEPI